jgi:hypothetical protein
LFEQFATIHIAVSAKNNYKHDVDSNALQALDKLPRVEISPAFYLLQAFAWPRTNSSLAATDYSIAQQLGLQRPHDAQRYQETRDAAQIFANTCSLDDTKEKHNLTQSSSSKLNFECKIYNKKVEFFFGDEL